MTAICNAAIHLCRVRVTRLDTYGNPAAGPNNVYVSDQPLMLSVKPVIEAGQDKTLVGGCDCIVASYRGLDKLKRFDLELDLATLEPALLEIMLGATAISQGGAISGVWWPSQLSCDGDEQPNVAFEGWQDAWEDDHQADAPIQYVHWVWPSTRWQLGDHSLQNDFNQPKLTGFSRANPNWGDGIFGDYPEASGDLGGWFFTNQLPTALCDYQTEGLT